MIYGYIRVSSDRQTVENQRFEINKFCERNKLVIDGWIEVILCFVLIVTISLYDEKSSEFGCFDVLSAKYPQNLRNFL